VFPRAALSTLLIVALSIFESDPTGNPVWPILGDRDRRFTSLVDLIATLDAAYSIAERAGGAVSHCSDDLPILAPFGSTKGS
jgi:hypothetical protein